MVYERDSDRRTVTYPSINRARLCEGESISVRQGVLDRSLINAANASIAKIDATEHAVLPMHRALFNLMSAVCEFQLTSLLGM